MIDLPRTVFEMDGLRFRLPRESDANDIVAACADPASRRFLHRLPHPYQRSDALWWVTEGVPASWAMGGAAFVITDRVSDNVIGAAGIGRVVAHRRQGEVGFWVAPGARGRGVARASTAGLSSWALEHGFDRLELPTEPENTAGQRVAMAAGYCWEGVRRLAGVRRDGTRHDLIVWTRLSEDPPGPTTRVLPDLPGGELTDGMIVLRPLGEADADDMYHLAVLPDIVASGVPPREPTVADVVRLCTQAASRWLAGTRADLSIRDSASGSFAGQIGAFNTEPATRQAMIGYSLLPRWRGRGYATRAVVLLAEWAFTIAGLARLVAGTSPANGASQRVLERAGFVREGRLRGRLPLPTGGRQDDLLYGLLPTDLHHGQPPVPAHQ